MELLKNLKLDTWWGIVLYLGALLTASSLWFKPDFIEEKHLFGLGLGMAMIGLSFFIAEKTYTGIKPPNVYTGPGAYFTFSRIQHNLITLLIFIGGLIISIIFLAIIIWGLLK